MDYKDYLDADEISYLADLRKAGINVEWIISSLAKAVYTHGFDNGIDAGQALYDEGFKHGQEAELNARADAIERNRTF